MQRERERERGGERGVRSFFNVMLRPRSIEHHARRVGGISLALRARMYERTFEASAISRQAQSTLREYYLMMRGISRVHLGHSKDSQNLLEFVGKADDYRRAIFYAQILGKRGRVDINFATYHFIFRC